MQIQLSWVRDEFPRGIKPLAKGTNTLVFADPDPSKVIVFMMCPAKYQWWIESGLVLNPNTQHFVDHIDVEGWYAGEHVAHSFVLRRVEAKRLYKLENGSKQKKEAARVLKAMDKIHTEIITTTRYGFNAGRLWAQDFWNRISETDLPTADMAKFATDFYVLPDLGLCNVTVDADGEIVWSDLFVDENVMEFVHMRKEKPRGNY